MCEGIVIFFLMVIRALVTLLALTNRILVFVRFIFVEGKFFLYLSFLNIFCLTLEFFRYVY